MKGIIWSLLLTQRRTAQDLLLLWKHVRALLLLVHSIPRQPLQRLGLIDATRDAPFGSVVAPVIRVYSIEKLGRLPYGIMLKLEHPAQTGGAHIVVMMYTNWRKNRCLAGSVLKLDFSSRDVCLENESFAHKCLMTWHSFASEPRWWWEKASNNEMHLECKLNCAVVLGSN